MESEPLSQEDDYCLDIAGYLIIRNALTQEEVSACNTAIDHMGPEERLLEGMLEWEAPWCDPFVQLREHPVLVRYLQEICIGEFRLNRHPRLLGAPARGDHSLIGGNEPRDWSRSYFQMDQARFVQGVTAVWALTDLNAGEGGFVLVPGTHKSQVETPPDLLHGSDDMGLVEQPVLKAGDLLLCVETVLHGIRAGKKGKGPQRLLSFGYIGSLVRRSNGAPAADTDRDRPAWVGDMTAEQRVIMGVDRPNPAPIVHSDGSRTWLDEKGEGTFHPSIYIRDPNCDIDEQEFYFWDLCAYLVIRGVMDEEWLAAANEAIDVHTEQIERGSDAAHGAERLAGKGLSMLTGLLDLPQPHCEPFRRMIANPALVQRLNWMSGSGFVLDSARAIIYEKGTSGHGLHSGPVPGSPRSIYALQNGRSYCETINVAWQLRDASPEDGGFMCIPGSHKCRYELPDIIRSLEDERGLVKHVPMKAGDVVLFMGSAQIHGAYPWTNDTPRRGVIANYVSRSLDQPAFRF